MRVSKQERKVLGLLGVVPLLFFEVEAVSVGIRLPLAGQPAIAQPVNPQLIAQISVSPTLSQGNTLLDTGYEQYQKGQLREALESYRRALETVQQPGADATDQLLRAEAAGIARQSMGLVYARLGQYQNALDTLNSAIKLQQEVQNRAAKMEGNPGVRVFLQSRGRIRSTYSLLGLVYNRLGQYTKALTRNQATEPAVVQKMQSQPVIHLATHGLLDDFKGLGVPGAIALAPNSPNPPLNEGLLTANEILDLKLHADLVVLSACDTGRGRITGDGVIGLSRSLLLAGAANVVVSLWAVPDEATAELMTQFYRELLTTPDKATALRQAMLKTLQNHPQPRDWAAFILIGSRE